jgi:hypothetical protein
MTAITLNEISNGANPTQGRIPYPFAPVPIAMLDEEQLTDGACRAYGLMLACRDGSICRISEKRLGDRLHRSPRTAHKYIHELIFRGHIEPMNSRSGRCGRYRLVAATAKTMPSALGVQGNGAAIRGARPTHDPISPEISPSDREASDAVFQRIKRDLKFRTIAR